MPALCLVAVALGGEGSSLRNEQDEIQHPKFGAQVDLVTINVAMMNQQGLPPQGVQPDEVKVSIDGTEHKTAFLLPTAEMPLDVLLLIDLSQSMDRQPWREHALQFLDSLAPSDCVLLAGFSAGTGGFLWGRPREDRILEALYASEAAGETALYDGLIAGLAYLTDGWVRTLASDLQIFDSVRSFEDAIGRRSDPQCPVALSQSIGRGGRPSRRKVVVVITDGADSVSVHGRDDVLVASSAAGIPIFGALEVPRTALTTRSIRRSRASTLRNMLLDSGGRYLAPGYETFSELILWLRGTHLIGFYLTIDAIGKAAGFTRHEIALEATRPDVDIVYPPVLYWESSSRSAALQGTLRGLQAIQSLDDESAIDALDAAIAQNPHSASAFFLRAEARSRLGHQREALNDALTTVELAPGAARAHALAAELAFDARNYPIAWEQAVQAAQAGADTSRLRERLADLSLPPANLDQRLRLPRVAVEKAPGTAGDSLLVEAATQTTIRAIRDALAKSARAALTTDVASATFRLRVAGVRVSEELPREFRADLELVDPEDKRKYGTSIDFDDVNDATARGRDLAKAVDEILDRISRAEERGPD